MSGHSLCQKAELLKLNSWANSIKGTVGDFFFFLRLYNRNVGKSNITIPLNCVLRFVVTDRFKFLLIQSLKIPL